MQDDDRDDDGRPVTIEPVTLELIRLLEEIEDRFYYPADDG